MAAPPARTLLTGQFLAPELPQAVGATNGMTFTIDGNSYPVPATMRSGFEAGDLTAWSAVVP